MVKSMINAVSGLIYHENKFFIVTRSPEHRTFPGYTSLPGGMVKEMESPQLALIREIKEELQLDLLAEEISQSPLAQMSSPSFHPQQFINQIFLIQLKGDNPTITLNEEHSSGDWLTLSELIHSWKRGERAMIPPLRHLLEKLALLSFSEIVSLHLGEITPRKWEGTPSLEMIHGIEQCLVNSPTLPPHTMTNAFIIGDVLIDPSPQSENDFQSLDKIFKERTIRNIFLTHTHPDHFHLIEKWGLHWDLPILVSEYCHLELKRKLPAELFKNLKWRIVRQDEVITDWLGHQVKVDEVPGHHQGQLALYAQLSDVVQPAWYLASDLFQSGGSVVIGVDDGDLLDYIQSLNKVINLNPRFIFPSHGMVHGGVEILKKILRHRIERHRDIAKFHSEGMSEQEILHRLYFMIDRKLWPLALENIKSHLKALTKQL